MNRRIMLFAFIVVPCIIGIIFGNKVKVLTFKDSWHMPDELIRLIYVIFIVLLISVLSIIVGILIPYHNNISFIIGQFSIPVGGIGAIYVQVLWVHRSNYKLYREGTFNVHFTDNNNNNNHHHHHGNGKNSNSRRSSKSKIKRNETEASLTSVIDVSKNALKKSSKAVDVFSRIEGLDAHGKSVSIRNYD